MGQSDRSLQEAREEDRQRQSGRRDRRDYLERIPEECRFTSPAEWQHLTEWV
jgi:hypothetical protein